MSKQVRYNNETRKLETNHNAWLSDYELYVLEEALTIRIAQATATRNKCGIPADDMARDINQNIQAMRSIAEKFGMKIII
ncbi:hypothetical protein [Paenibacillus agilis]|uniref:Uncharacterized protein n=1 Tax=Paenibacillus agilis TaxID=3020863 RepID=A0A559IEG9_9BACL|nr:hypothetical protein [Paenibacillus agilis]TVX86049.1 hypothetical protein FPZ44_24210 [Paenibacillus agilis]